VANELSIEDILSFLQGDNLSGMAPASASGGVAPNQEELQVTGAAGAAPNDYSGMSHAQQQWGFLFGRPEGGQYREDMLRGADKLGAVGNATNFTGAPKYDPQVLRETLARLHNSDPVSFAKQVAGYTGQTIRDPRVILTVAGLGGIANAVEGTTLPKVVGDYLLASAGLGTAGEGLSALGDAELKKVGAGVKSDGPGTPTAKVADGEEIGPKMPSLSRKDIASAINGGAARRSDGSIDGSKVIQLLKGQTLASDVGGGSVSHYKQTSHYEDLLDPGAAPRALQAYAQAKNDVYARYEESLKAVANNPKARDSMLAQIEKQANEEALRVVPKEYHGLVASAEEAKPAETPAPAEEDSGFWDAAKKPLALTAAGIATYLVASKLLSPQQAKSLVAAAGGAAKAEVPSAAGLMELGKKVPSAAGLMESGGSKIPSAAGLSDLIPPSASAKAAEAFANFEPKAAEVAQQAGIPYATRGRIPYIPQARGEPPDSVAARIARALRRTSSEGSGPQINLGPEIENATLKSGLPGNSLATPRITSKAGLARVPREMVSEGSGPTISAGRTIAGEAPVPQPTRNLPAEFSDKFGWAGGGKGPTIDPNAAQKAIKAIDTAIYDRKAASLQLSKLGKTSGRDTELDRLMALREHIIRMVK